MITVRTLIVRSSHPGRTSAFVGLAAPLMRRVSERRRRTVSAFLDAVRAHDPIFLRGDRAQADVELVRLADQLDVPTRRHPRDAAMPRSTTKR